MNAPVPAPVTVDRPFTAVATPGETSLALAADLTWDEWRTAGAPLLRGAASSMWWIGDWLLYAEQHWATDPDGTVLTLERARIRSTVTEMSSLDLQTLKNYRHVAKRIPPARRRPKVPWAHHREVAALPPDVADGLLAAVELEGWSTRDLTAAIKRAVTPDVKEVDPGEKPLRMSVRVVGAPKDEVTLAELVSDAARRLEADLGVRGVRATVEVA